MDRNAKIVSPAALELLGLAVVTLATCGVDGEPHAAPVYFAANDHWELYFFSDQQSQHSADLAHNPRLAAAIYPECFGWQEIRGLQLRGVARLLSRGPAWDAAWQVYVKKYPFVKVMKAVVRRNALYAFLPDWVRLVDNRQGFGFKQEWTLP
jgi:uncharacterized protein YhbP (UPF0306 family)